MFTDHTRYDLIYDKILRTNEFHQSFVAFDIETASVPRSEKEKNISSTTEELSAYKLISIAWHAYNPAGDEYTKKFLWRRGTSQESLFSLLDEFYVDLCDIQEEFNRTLSKKIDNEKWRLIRLKNSEKFHNFPVEKQAELCDRLKYLDDFYSLNVYGWNSERFDLTVIINALTEVVRRRHPHLLVTKRDKDTRFEPKMNMIQRGAGTMLASYGNIKFKDMMNLVERGTSLEKFVQSLGLQIAKAVYPYERFKDTDELISYKGFPPYSDFYSSFYIPVEKEVHLVNKFLIEHCWTIDDLAAEIDVPVEKLNSLADSFECCYENTDENIELLAKKWEIQTDEIKYFAENSLRCFVINEDSKKFFNISLDKYLASKDLFEEEKCETMLDWLRVYNLIDTDMLSQGIVEYSNQFAEKFNVNIHQYISLAQVAEKIAFGKYARATPIYSITDAELRKDIREALTGGMTHVFHRLIELNQPDGPLPHAARYADNGELFKMIKQLDANSLYPFTLQDSLPCGPGIAVYPGDIGDATRAGDVGYFKLNLLYEGKESISLKSLQYLEYLRHQSGVDIQHAYHIGEKKIGKYSLDGYYEKDNIRWGVEFYGCYWHKCRSCKIQTNEDADEERDKERKKFIEKKIDILKIKRECHFDKFMKRNMADEEFARNARENWAPDWCPFLFHDKKLREKDLIDALIERKVFGFAMVEIEPSKAVYNRYGDLKFPMIFKKTKIERNMLSENQKIGNLEMPVSQNTLIYNSGGEKMLLITPLLYFYLDMGYIIKKVHYLLMYNKEKPMAPFVDRLVADRIRYHIAENKVGEKLSKLVLNIVTGLFGKNVSKYRETKYIDDADLYRYIRSPLLEKNEIISAEGPTSLVKIVKKKKTQRDSVPTHISAFIYQKSKLVMFNFIDNICTHLKEGSFKLCYADTDSIMIAYTGDDVETLVKSEKKESWKNFVDTWMVPEKVTDQMLRESNNSKKEAEKLLKKIGENAGFIQNRGWDIWARHLLWLEL
ncbi:Oidioi.mRNA.OKI2018_I69.chr2.g5616.t1.cds [Oikopleura dioica]|uniref:Oidioi.mRNA.OKI2018_I69.chr2.g5616.t1.cds n=1 Tax=Oikopleura dioica TaxID=34765 RepID=A0ABN7T6T2_OIKDI|nr:Oidioi.mRNA.OKI2018_I69.chr2.g5616.t1.cds [Oikopleura dioica]